MSSLRLRAMRTAFRAVGAGAPGGDTSLIASGSPFVVESRGQRLAGWEWERGPTARTVTFPREDLPE